jgi:class 3 adenylate cyclase
MSGLPETGYVAVGDADVAYQVVGDGRVDLLFCYGLGSHIEFNRQVPTVAAFQDRLATFSRLITFDRRGMGASDGVPRNAVPTWEEWAEDVMAVMNVTQCERAAIFAAIDSGPMAILFAAMHPERVSGLVLLNTGARFIEADDYPIGIPRELADEVVRMISASWGTPEFVALANPSADAEFIAKTAPVLRASATPRTAAALMANLLSSDVRPALALLCVPTLVLQSKAQPLSPVEQGRYLAEHIDSARFVELPGSDLSFTRANLVIADEIAEFLTGERTPVEVERVLTTVLFTDIVDSTKRAAAIGDHQWRVLLDSHDRIVRDELLRFRGREINTTGDGFVASFDGPARAIRCALAIRDGVATIGLDIRVGIHTGEVELRGDDIGGIAVNIAARIEALAEAGSVQVSRTVVDLVAGSGLAFDDRGEHQLKGIPDSWRLYAVSA